MAESATEEKMYHSYKSGMQSMKMITNSGRRIHFINHRFITDNEEEIEYLDAELAKGNTFFSAGDKVSSVDADPMAALKEKMKKEAIAEYLAKEQAELEAGDKVLDTVKITTSTSEAGKLNPASAAKLSGLAKNSVQSNSGTAQ